MKHLMLLALALTSMALMGCPKRGLVSPDYDAARRHSEESHDSMNREK